MFRLVLAGALAASVLSSTLPALAAPQPPLPPIAQTYEAGSVRVDRFGNGKDAVVFIPGLTCGPWEFAREIALLQKDRTVYALTLPGFDGRAAASGQLFQTASADIWKFLDAQHVARPVLIGHSLGGTMALLMATQHPERLRGVIAIDGLPVFPGAEDKTPAQRTAAGEQMRAMMGNAATPAAFEFVEKSYVLPYLVTDPADAAAMAKLVAKSDPKASGDWMAQDYAQDLRPALAGANVPVLEIAPYDPGVDSKSFASAAAKQAYYAGLLAKAPHAKVEMVSGSRHFVMYDKPAELDADLTAQLHTLP
ncbi:MAG TPA: alpha/beta fold hydrolase [Candidatus Baltobacteraceae bacterium]|nr:alpha/beta fold hydrolase [Candidatus Baltobacteraceae bacterium]